MSAAIGSMMRSSDTPPFADIVGQLFRHGTGDQKANMLNTILAIAGLAVLGQFSGLIPGLGSQTQVTAAQAQAVSADAIIQIANHAEQHDPTIIDRMSQVYAQHPTLVKTLGTGAMVLQQNCSSLKDRRQYGKRRVGDNNILPRQPFSSSERKPYSATFDHCLPLVRIRVWSDSCRLNYAQQAKLSRHAHQKQRVGGW